MSEKPFPGRIKPPASPTAWLWKLAAVILVMAGGFAWLLSRNQIGPGLQPRVLLILTLAIATAGICIISATAQWWMKR